MSRITIQDSIDNFISECQKKRKSKNTIRSYTLAYKLFTDTLDRLGINPRIYQVTLVNETWFKSFISDLECFAPKSARLYISAVKQWYLYIIDLYNLPINISTLQRTISQNIPEDVAVVPTEPDFKKVNELIKYILAVDITNMNKVEDKLRVLRDRAIILVLSDTGLSIETLRLLTWGNFDVSKKCIVYHLRKNQQVVFLNERTQKAFIEYQKERTGFDLKVAQNARNVPIFVQHGNRHLNQVAALATRTIHRIIQVRTREAFKDRTYSINISPIWLRLYYERSVARSVADMLHPKIIDRCTELLEDGHYENAVFDAMKVLEEEVRIKANLTKPEYGANLVSKAMTGGSPIITFSPVSAEQEAVYCLFRGAIGYFKNPSSHRFIDETDGIKARQCLAFASLLLRMLDEVE